MPVDRSLPNANAVMRNARLAEATAASRHDAILARIDSLGDNIHADLVEGLKTMADDIKGKLAELEANQAKFQEEVRAEIRAIQVQLADVSGTLKGALPGLKTQRAASESR